MHFHGRFEVDVRVTREFVGDCLRAGPPDTRLSFRRHGSDWVAVRLRSPQDLALARELCEEAVRRNQ